MNQGEREGRGGVKRREAEKMEKGKGCSAKLDVQRA